VGNQSAFSEIMLAAPRRHCNSWFLV